MTTSGRQSGQRENSVGQSGQHKGLRILLERPAITRAKIAGLDRPAQISFWERR